CPPRRSTSTSRCASHPARTAAPRRSSSRCTPSTAAGSCRPSGCTPTAPGTCGCAAAAPGPRSRSPAPPS
ncbi:MAG: hypothetical protein AVDCRST_MAG41-4452, partial [uncultured Corynebacteriales bacterium]